MRFDRVKELREWDFVRLVGVKREVYEAMVEAVESQHSDFGRPAKLCLGDQVLLCLMYWREYRTLAAIGFSYGVSETTACASCRTLKKPCWIQAAFVCNGSRYDLISLPLYKIYNYESGIIQSFETASIWPVTP